MSLPSHCFGLRAADWLTWAMDIQMVEIGTEEQVHYLHMLDLMQTVVVGAWHVGPGRWPVLARAWHVA